MQGHTETHITGMCRTLPFRNESFHINLFLKTLLFSHSCNVTQNEAFLDRGNIIPATDLSIARKSGFGKAKGKYISALQQSCCYNTTNELKRKKKK